MVKKAYIDKRCGKELINRLASKDLCLFILIEAIKQINPKNPDKAQFQNIHISLASLKERMKSNDNNCIARLKNSIKKIMETIVEFEDEKYWRATSFFEKAAIEKTSSDIYVNIAVEFIPYLTELREFLVINESVIGASLRSARFYTYLRSIHKDTPKKIKPEVIQAQMDVSYQSYGDFKRKFLIPIQQDLQNIGINIAFTENKGVRNKVESLDFFLNEPQEKLDKQLSEIKAKEKQQVRVVKVAEQSGASGIPSTQKTKALIKAKQEFIITPEEQAKIDAVKAQFKPKLSVKEY